MTNKYFYMVILTILAALTAVDYAAAATDPNEPEYTLIENMNPEDAKVTFDFQDVRVQEVLDYLSRTAGLVIVADSFPSGRINLISKQPLNIDEVITLINTVLYESGYAAIRTDRTLKLVNLSEAKYSNIRVTQGSDPDKIKDSDEIVTHIIPIRYANAIQLMNDLMPLISVDTVITSNEASNSLIITDTTSNIKRLVRIVKNIDTQMSSVGDVKVFLLNYADAENTADLINNVFDQQTRSSGGNPFARMQQQQGGRGGRGGRGGGGNNMASMMMGGGSTGSSATANMPVIADADERTNAVVVTGPADVLEVIAEVIKELDSNPDDERSLFIYKLKYAQAANIQDRLNTLFQELESINQQNARSAGGFGGRGGGGTARSAGDSSGNVSDEVYIEADEDTNTLIIMTSSKNYEKIEQIIEQLDIPIPQVLIKVLLAELTTSDGLEIGVDWTVETTNSRDQTFLNFFTYAPQPTEGWTSQIISGELDATLKALQELGSLNILSRPYIMTSNNQTASINVGQRYPFITDSQINENGNVFNTVDYEQIGITLEVTPTINKDNLVIMDVSPEIITPLEDTIQISENVDATIFASRAAQCRVAVPNGQTIVIGGLMQDFETESTEQIPLLGDLPVLGYLFKHKQIESEKTELLIFLTPQVAADMEELKKLTEHERTNSRFLGGMKDNASLQEQLDNLESVFFEGDGK